MRPGTSLTLGRDNTNCLLWSATMDVRLLKVGYQIETDRSTPGNFFTGCTFAGFP